MPSAEWSAFSKLRDTSIRWPHKKIGDLTPEECERTGWVLFKSCLVARIGWVRTFRDGEEFRVFVCGRYPLAAINTAVGAPVLIGHDNIGDSEHAHGFVDGPARRLLNGDLVLDIVLTDQAARDVVLAGDHTISLGAEWSKTPDNKYEALMSINHVALLHHESGRGAVRGARLTGAELWRDGIYWSR